MYCCGVNVGDVIIFMSPRVGFTHAIYIPTKPDQLVTYYNKKVHIDM